MKASREIKNFALKFETFKVYCGFLFSFCTVYNIMYIIEILGGKLCLQGVQEKKGYAFPLMFNFLKHFDDPVSDSFWEVNFLPSVLSLSASFGRKLQF